MEYISQQWLKMTFEDNNPNMSLYFLNVTNPGIKFHIYYINRLQMQHHYNKWLLNSESRQQDISNCNHHEIYPLYSWFQL